MGTSTVSGPFRSQNGFQELVNGVWTPVSGGGGGNPNDIVITTQVDLATTGTSCYWVDTGISAQTIQDSIASGGKWACFSGYDITTYVRTPESVGPAYQGWMVCTGNNTQLINCVQYESGGGGFYTAVYWNSNCGAVTAYPANQFNSPGVAGAGCFGNYCGLGYPTLANCGYLTTDVYCGGNGNSLACPMKVQIWMNGAGQCGNPFPLVRTVLTLKFNNFTAF